MEIRGRPGNLQYFGEQIKPLFTDSRSPLNQPQQQALLSLEEWFKDEKKWGLTAVVVMPTDVGKTGVICCLPFFMGGAVACGDIPRGVIDMDKPVLVITPGLDIFYQLKEDFMTNSLLKGHLTERDANKVKYSIFPIEKNRQCVIVK